MYWRLLLINCLINKAQIGNIHRYHDNVVMNVLKITVNNLLINKAQIGNIYRYHDNVVMIVLKITVNKLFD